MRVTIITANGKVVYENFTGEDVLHDNHKNRPELIEAKERGSGSSLRYSNTLNSDYFYFAKYFKKYYIRTALEYKTSILPVIKSDNKWQMYIFVILIFAILTLIYITKKITKPFVALREFVSQIESGEESYNVNFPKDDLGEVGEKIMNAFKQLESTKRYKQELTHNVAHELKTPVTGIRGYLETLLQQDDIDKETSRFFIERAYAQSLRLSAIIKDISILNKIEEAADKFEFEKINIYECLKEIESDLAFKFNEKNIRFLLNISTNRVIDGNYLLIYSLFKNLIDNSLEHAGEAITISINELGESNNQLLFSYYDTGKGVPEEHIHRVFERFYRVEEGRSRKSGGSGLGLSIVKNAIILHRGSISVKNRTEGGLQFDFGLAIDLSKKID
jgi:signal transduction histidine kinase